MNTIQQYYQNLIDRLTFCTNQSNESFEARDYGSINPIIIVYSIKHPFVIEKISEEFRGNWYVNKGLVLEA